jgi:hypothetical protein
MAPAQQGKRADISLRVAPVGVMKTFARVKAVVTVAGGFPIWAVTVNTPTRRLDYLIGHE